MRAPSLLSRVCSGLFILLASALPLAARADKAAPPPDTPDAQLLPWTPRNTSSPVRGAVLPTSAMAATEAEPNDTPATATGLGRSARIRGDIAPSADVDWYRFDANAGDRVYAATMTALSASGNGDSVLTLFAGDGSTVLEEDNDDGSLSGTSSVIAGAVLPASGPYYLRVRHFSSTGQIRPYDLYLQLHGGAPVAETEPNNPAQPLPPGGWASGVIQAAGDTDLFAIDLQAGDTVFVALDLDPARVGGPSWNGRLGFGPFDSNVLVVNDASTTSPNAEALFITAKESGTYFAFVDEASGGGSPLLGYHLSVSRFAAVPATASCTTYTSAATPVALPGGPGLTTSTLTIPGTPRIADLDLSLRLTHSAMTDLDVTLVAPGGNEVVLFTDVGSAVMTQMDLRLDDEAALPIGTFSVMSGLALQGESLTGRLAWFDGQNAGGTWTLRLHDDTAAGDGTLEAWSLTVCEPAPPPSCPAGTQPVTVYATDLETDDGGFTASGLAIDWAWGSPTAPPIASCASGSRCWKTNLAGAYSASSNQTLRSPAIALGGLVPPVTLEWAQQFQLESASFDTATLQVRTVGGGTSVRPWVWRDATMTQTVGNPSATVQQAAGWGVHRADLSAFAGQDIEALFNLTTDTSVQLAGLAVDDVRVTACEPVPSISLTKTVRPGPLDPMNPNCGTVDRISVLEGAPVTYCFSVRNTGGVTFDLHDLDDQRLGTILDAFPFTLPPGASAFLEVQDSADAGVTASATWRAFNTSPAQEASATGSTTVLLAQPGSVRRYCNAPGTPLVDGGPVSDILFVDDGLPIKDLDVALRLSHSWVGDLRITLEHLDSARSAVLVDRPGVPATAFGCSNDGVDVVVDDEGPDPAIESQCDATPPAIRGRAPGSSLLDAFDGLDTHGLWQLTVEDMATPDGGTLDSWCLELRSGGPEIDVSPASVSVLQPPDTQSSRSLGLANTGVSPLHWRAREAAPARINSPTPSAGMPAAPHAVPAAVRTRADCAAFESYAGPEPEGWARLCASSPAFHPVQPAPQGLSSTAYTHNMRAPAVGLYRFTLGDFPGQTLVGSLTEPFFAMDFDAAGETLYAIGNVSAQLGTLDTVTGAFTPTIACPPPDGGLWTGLTIDPVTNKAWASTALNLYHFDLGACAPVLVGPFNGGTALMIDIAIGPSGVMYGHDIGTDSIYRIDTATGAATLVGPTGFNANFAQGLDFDNEDGTLYAFLYLGGGAHHFGRIDLDTGALTPLASNVPAGEYEGAIPTQASCRTSDVPWLSLSGSDGTVAAGASTPLDVQIDTTGLAQGLYEAQVCIRSNDPDAGPGPGTNLVPVPVQLTVGFLTDGIFEDGFEDTP